MSDTLLVILPRHPFLQHTFIRAKMTTSDIPTAKNDADDDDVLKH